MLHTKYFSCHIRSPKLFESDKQVEQTDDGFKAFEKFLHEIGEEKIAHIFCTQEDVGRVFYTIIYRD